MSVDTARKVLQIEADSICRLIERLDSSFEEAITLLASCRGRIVTTGMGKSGIICRKVAATLSSTGSPALFMHPAEAIHGDLGMLVGGDVVIMISNSGETEELIRLTETLVRLEIPVISMLGNRESTLARHSSLVLDIGVDQEACPFGLAPTASTTAALALGDALAIALSERKGFQLEEFARLHPGGKLGKRLARVADLMHTGEQIPVVPVGTPMEDVIYEMSKKGLGVSGVVDPGGRLVGILSDGDLRRLLQSRRETFLDLRIEECMVEHPITIGSEELAVKALNLMESRKITSLMVIDDQEKIIGVLHLHDLWGTELF